jgi:hypothetical protein
MSLRACRECGHPVQSEDKACPHCGAQVGARSKLLVMALAGAALVVAAGVFLVVFQQAKAPRRVVTEQSPLVELQSQVDRWLSEGVVTQVEGRGVWVERALWQLRSEDERLEIAKTCGILAGLTDASKVSRCEIRDNRTGTVFAEWSPAAGLKSVTQ